MNETAETPAVAPVAAVPVAPKKPRGLAAVDPERRREISRMGGKAADAAGKRHCFNPETGKAAGQKAAAKLHAAGRAHRWTSEEAKEASKKGVHALRQRGDAPPAPEGT